MITISDIAQRAGVSRATVSHVLNGQERAARISPATQERVMDVAQELGYRRNELARAVITGKNQMLGFWVMQSNREPVVRVLAGAMKEANERGYSLKMLGLDDGALDERTLERCLEWRLAGIIAIHAPSSSMAELFPRIAASGLPFVSVDSQASPPGCSHIHADSWGGMAEVVEHLASLGHRRIAFLGGRPAQDDSISGAREGAYRATMARCGLGHECRVEHGDWFADLNDWQTGECARAVERLLDSPLRPSAVACASDHLAMLLIRMADERGLRVPHDLSVTGFDDVSVAPLWAPPLTTVAQPFGEMGRLAVRHLLSPDVPEPLVLITRLIERASTAPPSGA